MKINTQPMTNGISQLIDDRKATKPQRVALNRIVEIAQHAQNSAYARPPQPTFTYSESLSSALVEELTSLQLEKLATLGITLRQNTGMPYHTVKMIFPS